MRNLDKPSAVSAGLLVAFLAAFILLGFGAPRPAATVRADTSAATVATYYCAFNMSWDGTGCH